MPNTKPLDPPLTLTLKSSAVKQPQADKVNIDRPHRQKRQFIRRGENNAKVPKLAVDPTQNSKRPKSDAHKAVDYRQGGIVTNPDGSARIPLIPNPAQKGILDQLFAGPRLLRQLLTNHPDPIITNEDASLFMISHYNDLLPYLYTQRRSDAVDLLRNLIRKWSSDMSDDIAIFLPSHCSISSNKQVYVPIPRLGLIASHDTEALSRYTARRRYVEGFNLLSSNEKYFVDVTLEKVAIEASAGNEHSAYPKNQPYLTTPKDKALGKCKPKATSTKQRSLDIHIDQYLSMFNDSINRRLLQEMRVSQQYSHINFDRLEGWGVKGGLPSLGKRR